MILSYVQIVAIITAILVGAFVGVGVVVRVGRTTGNRRPLLSTRRLENRRTSRWQGSVTSFSSAFSQLTAAISMSSDRLRAYALNRSDDIELERLPSAQAGLTRRSANESMAETSQDEIAIQMEGEEDRRFAERVSLRQQERDGTLPKVAVYEAKQYRNREPGSVPTIDLPLETKQRFACVGAGLTSQAIHELKQTIKRGLESLRQETQPAVRQSEFIPLCRRCIDEGISPLSVGTFIEAIDKDVRGINQGPLVQMSNIRNILRGVVGGGFSRPVIEGFHRGYLYLQDFLKSCGCDLGFRERLLILSYAFGLTNVDESTGVVTLRQFVRVLRETDVLTSRDRRIIVPGTRSTWSKQDWSANRNRIGTTYIVRCLTNHSDDEQVNVIKIGFTTDEVEVRVRTYGNDYEYQIMIIVHTSNAVLNYAIEQVLLNDFACFLSFSTLKSGSTETVVADGVTLDADLSLASKVQNHLQAVTEYILKMANGRALSFETIQNMEAYALTDLDLKGQLKPHVAERESQLEEIRKKLANEYQQDAVGADVVYNSDESIYARVRKAVAVFGKITHNPKLASGTEPRQRVVTAPLDNTSVAHVGLVSTGRSVSGPVAESSLIGRPAKIANGGNGDELLRSESGEVWLAVDFFLGESDDPPRPVYVCNPRSRPSPKESRLANQLATDDHGLVDGSTTGEPLVAPNESDLFVPDDWEEPPFSPIRVRNPQTRATPPDPTPLDGDLSDLPPNRDLREPSAPVIDAFPPEYMPEPSAPVIDAFPPEYMPEPSAPAHAVADELPLAPTHAVADELSDKARRTGGQYASLTLSRSCSGDVLDGIPVDVIRDAFRFGWTFDVLLLATTYARSAIGRQRVNVWAVPIVPVTIAAVASNPGGAMAYGATTVILGRVVGQTGQSGRWVGPLIAVVLVAVRVGTDPTPRSIAIVLINAASAVVVRRFAVAIAPAEADVRRDVWAGRFLSAWVQVHRGLDLGCGLDLNSHPDP